MDLHSFLLEFEHERSAGEEGSLSVDPEAGPDMVRILTVHSAKGLEFRYVFVVNLIDRRFPTQRRADGISLPLELTDQPETDSEQHLQEERRLFYVAMTRAKEGLFLTSANDYGGARARKLSRFLHELDFEKPVQSAQTFINALDQDADPVSSSNTNDFHNASPNHFSFTQLVAFRTCPLQYKFAHVLKIPLFGKWTTSFGKTMHTTLQRFFELWMERQQSKQTELFSESSDDQRNKKNNLVPVSLSELLELYEQSWHDDWYTNDDQREKYRTRGHDQLKTLYATFAEEVPRPLGLEQAFTVKVGDVILKGRIDRMDRFDGGIEIIDYKTGSPKQEGDVKLSDKEQLFLYQIAAQEVLGLIPKRLTFHYLEDNSRVSFLGSEKQIEALKKQINDRAKAISQSDFEPTPGFHCNYCDFKEICPFRQS